MDMSLKSSGTRSEQRDETLNAGLQWEMTFHPSSSVFVAQDSEGLVIRNLQEWQPALRNTVMAYWHFQGGKDKRLYAVTDAFSQNNGQLGISDARYVNALKIVLQAFSPVEYCAHKSLIRVARVSGDCGWQTDILQQAVDHLRHSQIEVHALSHFNKYFNGMHSYVETFDHHWLMAVAKSYADDLLSAGPLESLVAVCFAYTQVIGKVLYVPFMSAAADNGDMSTAAAGFTAASDKVRHHCNGLELIGLLVQQDPANLPKVQAWIDKWFWRSVRLSSLIAIMQDYMLPVRTQSWKECWLTYVQHPLQQLFTQWAALGIQMPASWQHACEMQEHVSHQTWLRLCRYNIQLPLHVWAPGEAELNWLSSKYPGSFDAMFRPHLQGLAHQIHHARAPVDHSSPVLCGTCQLPVPGMDHAGTQSGSAALQDRYFCGLHCQGIFNTEPQKHSAQARRSAALAAWRMPDTAGNDGGLFGGSQDDINFQHWNGEE
ncbi:MAG: phenol 2-monooxygenase [Limnohabitans sp.]|nr:phenol 2-monooxygenase [Limnohabitans sp.]